MWVRSGIALAALAASFCIAQTSPRPQFEVASIRPVPLVSQGQTTGFHVDGAQVRMGYLSMKEWIAFAYQVKIWQIFGPDWIATDRFDVAATVPPGSSESEIRAMSRNLIEDRFQLKLHQETREYPVYGLILNRRPLRLTEIPPDDAAPAPRAVDGKASGSMNGVSLDLGNGSSWSFVPNRFEIRKLTMDVFASALERFADRPVVDMTGLKGQYSFDFSFNAEDYQALLVRSAIAAGIPMPPQAMKALEGSSSSSLSDALESVGLKLEPRKAPLDVIVVDSARRTPTEN